MLFLIFSWFLLYMVLNLFLFFPDFVKIFHNTLTVCNTRNRSNDIADRKKEIPVLMLTFSTVSQKSRLIKVYILGIRYGLWKSLAKLRCENRTSLLHAVQYKWQPGSVLVFCSDYFKNGRSSHQRCSVRKGVLRNSVYGTVSLALFLACS